MHKKVHALLIIDSSDLIVLVEWDVCLIKLDNNFDYDEYVAPVCLWPYPLWDKEKFTLSRKKHSLVLLLITLLFLFLEFTDL